MKNSNGKNKQITQEYLDQRLEEHAQAIVSAVDSVLAKRLTEVRNELRNDINNVQTLIDGYVKAQEDFKQEFEIMKKEHELMKKIIREKLGMEITLA